MPESLLLEVFEEQAKVTARAVESWKKQPVPFPGQVKAVQECVFLCLRFPDNVRDVLELEMKALHDEESQSAERAVKTRGIIERILSNYRELLAFTAGLVHDLEAQGCKFRRAEKLPEAAESLAKMDAWVKNDWPVCSAEELQEVREEIRRGEFLDADEAFAEIAGVTPEEWRERVRQQRERGQAS
jgi:hypothetical protein